MIPGREKPGLHRDHQHLVRVSFTDLPDIPTIAESFAVRGVHPHREGDPFSPGESKQAEDTVPVGRTRKMRRFWYDHDVLMTPVKMQGQVILSTGDRGISDGDGSVRKRPAGRRGYGHREPPRSLPAPRRRGP